MKPERRAYPLGDRLVHFVALGFGVGTVPVAPGTIGTIVAIPFYLMIQNAPALWYAAIVLAMFVLGMWICRATERDLGAHDHPAIVWDEIVGYLITMFLAPPGWIWVVLGFILFRLFDIWKPFPIRAFEQHTHGGLGIMLDDALAGLYALLSLQALAYTLLPRL